MGESTEKAGQMKELHTQGRLRPKVWALESRRLAPLESASTLLLRITMTIFCNNILFDLSHNK